MVHSHPHKISEPNHIPDKLFLSIATTCVDLFHQVGVVDGRIRLSRGS